MVLVDTVQEDKQKRDWPGRLVSFFCHESYSQCQEKKYKYKVADASYDVTVPYKECEVVTKRNLTLYYSRLPPRGRLEYFSSRAYNGADAGVCTAGYCAACLDCAE